MIWLCLKRIEWIHRCHHSNMTTDKRASPINYTQRKSASGSFFYITIDCTPLARLVTFSLTSSKSCVSAIIITHMRKCPMDLPFPLITFKGRKFINGTIFMVIECRYYRVIHIKLKNIESKSTRCNYSDNSIID